mmetsp:Transcript_13741/g.19814  ORF Transcript_13741/g.19814 Transcript_13741/m.19814 type:complete len:179 (-) Transcript_13741:1059-1595(-)
MIALNLRLLLCLTLICTVFVSAFIQPSSRRVSSTPTFLQDLIDTSGASSGKIGESGAFSAKLPGVQDAGGKEVSVGAVVRVAVEGLKAYHVNKKAWGSFDAETKELVPNPADGPRITKCLTLPVGMCGEVVQVYDVDKVSANCPILVRFAPGVHVGDGIDPPLRFNMHFDSFEVEIVE